MRTLWGPLYQHVSRSRSPAYFGYCDRTVTVLRLHHRKGIVISLQTIVFSLQTIVFVGLVTFSAAALSIGYEGEKIAALLSFIESR